MIKSLRVSLDGYKKYGTAVGIPFTVTIADVLEVYEKQKGLCAVSGEPMTNNQCAFTSAGCMEKANMWIRLVDPKRGVLRHSYDLVRREYAEPQIHNAFSLKARNCYGRRASKASESNQLKPATQVVRVYYEAQFQVPTPTPGLRSILPKASEQPPIGPPAEPLIASPIKSPLEFRNEPPIEPMIEPLTEPLIEPSIEVRVDAIISDWLIDIDESTTPGWLTDLSTEMAESTSDTYIDLSTEMAESTSDTYIDLDLEADQWSTLEQGSVHDPIDAIDAVLSSKEHDTTDTCVSELFGSLFGDQVSELYAPLL
ncbi:Hypothetical protein MVR_LOCUS33 [uncultured virus]|nr:Hypothetical protein MVR_LOCUS33 [uncultured virus]